MFIIYVVEWILFSYFFVAAWYIFFFSFAGIWGYSEKETKVSGARRYAVLIPGYKEDAVIVDVALRALEQEFPKSQFEVVVIADSFQEKTLAELRQLPVRLIPVSFEKSTKSKALNKAMEEIGDEYDVALILDADNIMTPQFISKIDQAFAYGYKVVQGHRVAKNLNTPIAILDAISEEVNNHIFRRGHRIVGLSSALIGSGMAFDYHLFKKMMSEIKAIGGFDKELELKLLRDSVTIEYVDEAIVLDEKVQKKEVFEKQRTRWLSAQFVYFKRFALEGVVHLVKHGNVDFFDKVYQMISPPRVIHAGIVSALTFGYSFLALVGWDGWLSVSYASYWGIFLLTILAFSLAIPQKLFSKLNPKLLLEIPKLFWVMFVSLFHLKGANKTFIHTTHGPVDETSELSTKSKTKIQ